MTTVYIARVTVGGNVVLDSAWGTPDEAKGVIERRVPAIAARARETGQNITIMALPATTNVTWAGNGKGVVVPTEHTTMDWGAVEHGQLSPDGTTVTW